MKYLLFIGFLIFGLIVTIYTVATVRLFGRMDWAEKSLGPTGTYSAWKMIGIGCIVASVLILRYM